MYTYNIIYIYTLYSVYIYIIFIIYKYYVYLNIMFELEIRNIDISGRFLHVILTQTTASGKKVKPLPPPVSVGVPCFSQNGGVGIVEDTSSGGWVTVSKFCKQRCFLFSFLFIVGDFEWDM